MGRTVLPYSQVWEAERQRWQKFRRALRREDQAHLDRLFESARLHLQAGVYASNPWPLESLLLSMLLEHQKALAAKKRRLQVSKRQKSEKDVGGDPAGCLPPLKFKKEIIYGRENCNVCSDRVDLGIGSSVNIFRIYDRTERKNNLLGVETELVELLPRLVSNICDGKLYRTTKS